MGMKQAVRCYGGSEPKGSNSKGHDNVSWEIVNMLVIVALGECVAIKMICCQMDFQTHLLLLLCWVVLKLPFIIIITIIKMVINFFSASPGTSYAGNILLLCGQMRLLCIFQENCTIARVVEFLCRPLSGDCQPLLDDTINGQQ